MSEANKAIARRFFEEVLDGGQLDLIEELFAEGYREHDPFNEEDTRGPDGVRREIEMYVAAFPDLAITVEDQVAEGNLVVTRWSGRGSHGGELMGLAPTGNEVTPSGITIHRIADGRIAEAWWNWDTLGLLRQVGAIPAEQPA